MNLIERGLIENERRSLLQRMSYVNRVLKETRDLSAVQRGLLDNERGTLRFRLNYLDEVLEAKPSAQMAVLAR